MKSSRNALILFFFLTTAAASALGWKEYQELIRLRAEVGSDDTVGLQKRLADAQNRLRSLEDKLAALRSRSRRGGSDPTDLADLGGDAKARADGAAAFAERRNTGGFLRMLNDPQARELMAIQMKGVLDTRYGSLFKDLNLTPQQVDQFKNLMMQKQQAVMDALAAAREQGLDPRSDPSGFKQVVADAQASLNDEIKTTLGDPGYAQYQQYEQTLPQRNTVSQVQQSLSYTSSPLTDDQASQLIQILSQNSPQGGDGGNGPLGLLRGPGQTGRITDQAITQAQGVLSAPQVQALQQVQGQQEAQQKLQQLMRGSASAGTAAVTAAAPGP